MTTEPSPVRYGDHARVEPGAPCLLCGPQTRRPVYTDHCHTHGWVRGQICSRCNILMALIDRRSSPRAISVVHPLTLAVLVGYAARCPDCQPFDAEDLGPTASLRPPRRRPTGSPSVRILRGGLKNQTDLLALRKVRLSRQLDADLRAYADQLGLTVNAAVITLLTQALGPWRVDGQTDPQRKGRGTR